MNTTLRAAFTILHIMHDLDRAIAAASERQWSIAIAALQNLSLTQIQGDRQVLNLTLQILTEGDFEQQWETGKIVPKVGEIAILPLLNLLNDPDVDLENRWCCARILGEFDRPPVIAALIAVIQTDADAELTAIAIGSLTKIGAPAIAALTEILATPDLSTTQRGMAVTILTRIRHSQTIVPLIQALEDPDPQLRTVIVEALGSFHDPRIPPLLLAKLTDVAASVRKAAAISLSLRGDLAVELNLSQHLRPLLFDLDFGVCEATALGLARLPDPSVVDILTEVLISPLTPDRLKSPVILALGWIGSRAAIDSAIAALAEISNDLAPEIIIAISKTEQERVYASQQLVNYLYCHESAHLPIVKQEIAAALGNLGNKATVPALGMLLDDADDRVRLYALTAMSKLTSIPTSYSAQ
ncbi:MULTISPECIES: HEAT repeat domain-containing protein [unclassified Chamaesiphon]|uniref:HEAT repeat domain-containing protein n=1 Tax=unclassified Chamaesiphon TaxID=2620921 RepID=UPI00286C64BB|nr:MULTISPECIES: HEAT repeat domain-containing protein [unclassified Chamaesiphon]